MGILHPELLEALAQDEKFLESPTKDITREQLAVSSEARTILGSFFRISSLQTEVTKSYFSGPRTIDAGHKKSAQTALQMTSKAHQGDLTATLNTFVLAKRSKAFD